MIDSRDKGFCDKVSLYNWGEVCYNEHVINSVNTCSSGVCY